MPGDICTIAPKHELIRLLLHQVTLTDDQFAHHGSNSLNDESSDPLPFSGTAVTDTLLPTHNAESSSRPIEEADDSCSKYVELNALEAAAISNAKKFLSQGIVQSLVDDIWEGRIVFWTSLSLSSTKQAQVLDEA